MTPVRSATNSLAFAQPDLARPSHLMPYLSLGAALMALDAESRAALFAHCAAVTVNAVADAFSRSPRRLVHADQLARATGLDMAVSWQPTVDNYLGRVTKARIP